MLEHLFGSRTRWKLLKLMLAHPEKRYYVRELTRVVGEKLNSIRRELANLEEWGIIEEVHTSNGARESERKDTGKKSGKKTKKASAQNQKKYYRANTNFILHKELKDLIVKSWLMVERSLVSKITQLGNVHMLYLSGRFVGDETMETDVLIVGTINREKLSKVMKTLSKAFGEDINYTIMSKKEFNYRKDVTDRFLYRILESRHIRVIDSLK